MMRRSPSGKIDVSGPHWEQRADGLHWLHIGNTKLARHDEMVGCWIGYDRAPTSVWSWDWVQSSYHGCGSIL